MRGAGILILPLVLLMSASLNHVDSVEPVMVSTISAKIQIDPAIDRIPEKYRNIILWINSSTNIPIGIVEALIYSESRWTERAIGPDNLDGSHDMGLMQINSRYASQFVTKYIGLNSADPIEPVTNLIIGMSLLSDLYAQLGDWSCAIAAYNCGIAREMTGDWPDSTKIFVKRILKRAGMKQHE